MKLTLFLILSLNILSVKCQNTELNELINYIYDDILLKKEQYFVLDKSIDYSIGDFELQNYQIRELKIIDPNFPTELITQPPTDLKQTDWRNLELSKTEFKTKGELTHPNFLEKNKVYYAFSSPIFSKNKEYCIITVSTNYSKSSEDRNYVMKRENGKWKDILNFIVKQTKTVTYH